MSGRPRKRVEEEAAAEEAWTLDNYAWDPQQCVARKRTKTTEGHSAQAVFGAHSYLEGSGKAAMLAAGSQLLQQQLSAVPCIEPLPELITVNPEECDPATHCEVTGCGLCLEGLKRYYIRMRVCEKHLHAPAVLVNGTISRFCQQCGKWQAVAEFEGSKKSCIATLERHNARHRAKVQARLAEQQTRGGAAAAEKAAAKAAKSAAAAATGGAKRRSGSAAPKGRAAAAAPSTSGASGGSAAGNSDNAKSSFGMADLMGTAASAFAAGGLMPYPPAMDNGGTTNLLQPTFGPWDAAGGANGAGGASSGAGGASSGAGGLPMRPPITTGLAGAGAGSAGNGVSLAGSGRLGSVEVTGGFVRLPQQQQQEQQQLLLPMLMSQEGVEIDRALHAPPHDAFRRASSMNLSQQQPLLLKPPQPPEDVRMALGAVKQELLLTQPPALAGANAPPPGAWRQGYPMGGPAAGTYDSGLHGYAGSGGYASTYPARMGSGMPGGPFGGGAQHAQHGYSQPYDGHSTPGHMQFGGGYPPQAAAGYPPHAQHQDQFQFQQHHMQQQQQPYLHMHQQNVHQHQQVQGYPANSPFPAQQQHTSYAATPQQNQGTLFPQQQYQQQYQYQHQQGAAPAAAGNDASFNHATTGSRGSAPSAATAGAMPGGGATGAATGATPNASSGSDTSGVQSQATARQAMAAAAAAAAAASGGAPQPRGSSGTAASGASGSAFANSHGGGSAAAAVGAGAGAGGAAAMSDSGALATRLNNVMAELSTLVAQVAHLQQPPPPALAAPAAGQALPARNDSAPADMPLPLRLPAMAAVDAADAAAGTAGHSPRSVSAQSAPTRPGSDAVTSSARAGSSSLSPIMDAALAMMSQVSELAAALQPGAEPGAAALAPQQQPGFRPAMWAVTTGMPAAVQSQPQQQQMLQQPGSGSSGWGSQQQPQPHQQHLGEMAASSAAAKPFPTEFTAAGPGFVVSTGYPGSSSGNGSGGGAAPSSNGNGSASASQQQAWIPPQSISAPYVPSAAPGQQQSLPPAFAGAAAAQTPYSAASHADSPSTTVSGSAAPSPTQPQPQVQPQSLHPGGGAAADAKPGDVSAAAAAAAFAPDADGDDLDEQLLGELFDYLEEENGAAAAAAAAAATAAGSGHATIAVAAQQAVGNYQQTMAAQPYPLPAASLAPPPAAAAGGAMAAPPPLVEDDVDEREFTRVSLKAMNVLPHELPPSLRANLRRWLRESRAEALQATLRPGCLQLVVDVARSLRTPAGAPVSGDLASVLIPPHDADQAAADVFRILGQRLRDTYVQVGRQVLQIRVGERPIVLSWEQAAEDGGLDNARFPELFTCSAPAVCAGADVSLELTGKHLCHPSTKAFARLRGHDLPAARLPNPSPPASPSDPATSFPSTSEPEAGTEADKAAGSSRADPATSSGSLLRVRVQLPAGAVGLMVVEAGVGHLLGGWWPVLVLPAGRDAAAAELGELSTQAQEAARAEAKAASEEAAAAPAPGGTAKRGFERLVRDLASVLETHADVCASTSPSSSAHATSTATPASPPDTATGASSSSPHVARSAAGATSPGAAQPSGSTHTRSSGDGTVDASTTAASAAGWSMYTTDTLTGTTGAGSTVASTLHTLTTTTTTGPRGGAAHHGGAHAAGAVGAGGFPGAGTAHAGAPVRLSSPTHSVDGAAAAPARAAPVVEPTADAVRKALARSARLLRYTIARGRPHLTALLLEAAHGLAAFPGALPAAAAAQSASAFMAAGIDLQALLPLAVLSGSVATVDVMVGFAAAVLRAPLRLDLPHGPAGLSALHLSALLRDGGVMASHLVASQPWAAWSWVCLGWQPPSEGPRAPAAATAAAGAAAGAGTESAAEKEEVVAKAEDKEGGDGAEKEAGEEEAEADEEEEEAEEEEEDLLAPVPLPTKLTPGALCVLLGQTAPLQRALALVQQAGQRRRLAAAGAASGSPGESDVTAALVGAVQAWGRTGAALMAALCEQLARQRL